MTIKNYPITPPPELVQQWVQEVYGLEGVPGSGPGKLPLHIATQAARWGGDQELEACCEWFQELYKSGDVLRAARRPKPPSLKEQALEALKHAPGPDYPNPITLLTADEHALIRRALEQLPE